MSVLRREAFAIPPDTIYLDGNSLGLMPHAAQQAVSRRLSEWASQAALGWDDWFTLAETLAGRVAPLVGAQAGEVAVTGSINSNLHSLLATFYRPTPERRVLVATELDFPTDLYALASWAEREGAELRLIASRDGETLDDADIRAALTPDVALALLPVVLYRSGQLLDVASLTQHAHEQGIVIGWDAAHSIGCLPHALHDAGADFAVWCHYKYLNAGPGAPGGLFVHERHHDRLPGLRGWWGHAKASQFQMNRKYAPAVGAGAYQLGTPPILALAALEGALTVFDDLDLDELRARSLELTDYLIGLTDGQLPEMTVVTPRESHRRGGHVSLAHPDAGQLSLALRKKGIVPDFRAPDVLRLAPVALYNTESELESVVSTLRQLLDTGEYKDGQVSGAVT